MRWPGSFLLVLGLAACGEQALLVVPELPSSIDYGAILVQGSDGGRRGSALAPVLEGHFEITLDGALEDGEIVSFAGFTRAQLLDLGVEPDRVGDSPMSLAGPKDPAVVSTFSATGEVGDPTVLEASGSELELTADWLPPCPAGSLPAEALSVHSSCSPLSCDVPSSIRGCALSLDLSACGAGLGRLEGVVDGRGGIDFGEAGNLGRCQGSSPAELTAMTVQCEGSATVPDCEIYVYDRDPEPWFESVESVPILDLDYQPWQHRHRRTDLGNLLGLVLLEDRAIVSTSRSFVTSCSDSVDEALHFVDLETMAVTATVSAPHCLRLLRRDPLGPGFLAVYSLAEGNLEVDRLARFDEEGRLLAEVELSFDGFDPLNHFTIDLLVLEDPEGSGPTVLLALASDADHDIEYLLRFQASDLTPVWESPHRTHVGDRASLRSLFEVDRGNFGFVDSLADILQIVSLSGEDQQVYSLQLLCPGKNFNTSRALLRGQRIVLLNVEYDSPQVLVIDRESMTCETAVSFEAQALPETMVAWPAKPEWQLVALMEAAPPNQASLSILDPEGRRFLPGNVTVGQGEVGDLAVDGSGRVWLTLIEEGKLVRLTPRSR